MNIKSRQEREREERRDLIIKAASQIISAEGVDNLSIRKIAKQIEYSPAIIYHYFKDKDDIIEHAFRAGYQKIIIALQSVVITATDPLQMLKARMHAYIDIALRMPDEYRSVQLSTSPSILKHTSILDKGASNKNPAIAMLCENLMQITGETDGNTIELTAQVILTATFGLIIRLINEKNLDYLQKEALINHHIDTLIDGIIKVSIDNHKSER